MRDVYITHCIDTLAKKKQYSLDFKKIYPICKEHRLHILEKYAKII